MQITYYHIDTFTDKLFSGNPAIICILEKWLPDSTLQTIAEENNLPATAFILREKQGHAIRWFTPDYELPLCGHGSLAAAYVIFTILEPTLNHIDFFSPTETLQATYQDGFITLNFPAKAIETCPIPELLTKGLGTTVTELYQHQTERCLAILNSEDEVKNLQPNMEVLKGLTHRGIVVTAPGKEMDFVSRTFYPGKVISEDPVTGSSHCLLAPYWSKRLEKTALHCMQVSKRGGYLRCQVEPNRVLISGQAVLYGQGTIHLP